MERHDNTSFQKHVPANVLQNQRTGLTELGYGFEVLRFAPAGGCRRWLVREIRKIVQRRRWGGYRVERDSFTRKDPAKTLSILVDTRDSLYERRFSLHPHFARIE